MPLSRERRVRLRAVLEPLDHKDMVLANAGELMDMLDEIDHLERDRAYALITLLDGVESENRVRH